MLSPYQFAVERIKHLEKLLPTSRAVHDVLAERTRQVAVEGWTPEHDDEHGDGEMAVAAACYALSTTLQWNGYIERIWPWDATWWKPKNPRRDLVRAAALLIAEIERLDRKESTGQ